MFDSFDRNGFIKYLKNGSWLLVSRLFSLVIAFFTTIYVIRYLGPENYGTLSYAVSFVGLFSFLSSFGIDQVVYRELIRRPEDEATILGSAFALKIIGGVLAVIATVACALIIEATQIELILISLVSITLIGAAAQLTSFSYQAKVMSKVPAVISMIIATVLAVAKLLVIFFDKGVIFFALVLVLESFLYAILFFISYQRHFQLLSKWKASKATMVVLLSTSWPLMLSTVSILIYSRIDQVMLRHYLDITSVGIYDAAVRLSDVWYIIPNVILASLFPAIINAQKTSPILFRKRIQLCAALLIGLNLIIIIPTTFLSPYIISILFGEAFIGSASVLTIYIWSLIGFSLAQLVNSYLIAEDYVYIYLYTSVATVCVNIVLNIILIPTHGVNGAAFATLVSYSLIPLLPFGFKKIRVQLLSLNQT